MSERKIVATPSAYSYPLLIKQLLHTPLTQSPQQEIVYRDIKRLTYVDLRDRIGRLGSALAKIGVRPGDTVGVLDWDSNRFLEAFARRLATGAPARARPWAMSICDKIATRRRNIGAPNPTATEKGTAHDHATAGGVHHGDDRGFISRWRSPAREASAPSFRTRRSSR